MEEQQSVDLKKIINSKVDIKEKDYREYDAINYSTLSTLASSPGKVNTIREESESMVLGSIVDNLLTMGSYGDEYMLASSPRPAGQLGDYTEHYYRFSMNGSENPHADAYIASGIKNMKAETAVKNFMEKGGLPYVDMLRNAGNRKLVSMDVISRATGITNRLKDSEIGNFLFGGKKTEGIDIMYQVPIVFDLPENKGVGKILLDVVVVNHIEKTVTPIDLKTMHDSSSMFRVSFMKWKYYLQASYYSYGLSSVCKYSVEKFSFLTISTTNIEPPVLWKCSNQDLMVGRSGIMRPNSNNRVKGWEELIDELEWHKENDCWDLPREFYSGEPVAINMFDKWQ